LAPEVLSAAPQYGPSVDIYSLGATCIEMAEGSPPLSHIAPLAALLLIAQDGARPSLTSPSSFSPSFGNFVGACLQREAALRPTAAELLRHPFLHAPQARIDSAGGVSLILAACVDDFAAEGLAAELPWSPVQDYTPTSTNLAPVLPNSSSTVIFSSVQGPALLPPPEYVLAALQVKTSAPATSAGSTGSSSGSGSGSGATQVSVYRLLADPGFVSRMRASEASQQLAVLDSVYLRDADALRSEYAAARTLLESRLRES
jgi:serine/threonine protein kinase